MTRQNEVFKDVKIMIIMALYCSNELCLRL